MTVARDPVDDDELVRGSIKTRLLHVWQHGKPLITMLVVLGISFCALWQDQKHIRSLQLQGQQGVPVLSEDEEGMVRSAVPMQVVPQLSDISSSSSRHLAAQTIPENSQPLRQVPVAKLELAEQLQEQTKGEDGCGIRPVGDVTTARKSVTWSNYSNSSRQEIDYLMRVHGCVKNFPRTYATKYFPKNGNGDRPWETLLCDLKITHDLFKATLQEHNNILFLGDSVLRQQYFTFVCMLDPEATEDRFVKFHNGGSDTPEFSFVHHHSSSAVNAASTTTVHYAAFGPKFAHRMRHLYEFALPWAIGNYTQQDAIVVDASRHFPSSRFQLYDKILSHLKEQSTKTKASFYYMEPTPEEWPTSNGLYFGGCYLTCECHALDDAKLKGRATPYDPHVNLTDPKVEGKEPVPKYDDFVPFYPNTARLFTTEMDPADRSCLPDCTPADWRVQLVRSKLIGNQTTTHNNNNNNNNNNFHLVPTYWQLVGKPHHSSAWASKDCTHRSLDAIVMMNEQLIRTMRRNIVISTSRTGGQASEKQ